MNKKWITWLYGVSALWVFLYVILIGFYSLPTWIDLVTILLFLPVGILTSPILHYFIHFSPSKGEELEPNQRLIEHCQKLGSKVGYGSSRKKDGGFEEWCVIEDDGVIIKDPEVNEHLREIDRLVNHGGLEKD